MSKGEKQSQANKARGLLDKFESGRELGPVEDRSEYEQRINSLPSDEKEIAQESARLADLCQYFAQQKIDVPGQILEQVGRLSSLPIAESIRVLKAINRELMEYLDDVGQNPGIRQ